LSAFSGVVDGRLEDIGPFSEALRKWAEAAAVPQRIISNVELMLDELITNVIVHGYRGAAGQVQVVVQLEPGRLVATVTDQSFAFNPLTLPETDTSLGLAEREIGGLGIHFVRQMADEVAYRRVADGSVGTNELRLVKALS
jgi:anti-sigma regulatory factor (Ser/Thr protein kinase)